MATRVWASATISAKDAAPGLLDELEQRQIDSVWLSDLPSNVYTVDPLIALGYAAGRTKSLKLGTGTLVLAGRNPVAVATQLAGLIALAPKRILPTFGIRAIHSRDRFTSPGPEVFEEKVTLIRRLLTEPVVTHTGPHFPVHEASIGPLPTRGPDIWLTGRVPAEWAGRRVEPPGDVPPFQAKLGVAALVARESHPVARHHRGERREPFLVRRVLRAERGCGEGSGEPQQRAPSRHASGWRAPRHDATNPPRSAGPTSTPR